MGNSTEEKKNRFKRLGVYRTNEILKRLRVLGNCSNKQLYEYTSEEIDKIFSEIRRKTNEIESKFKTSKKDEEFKL